MQLETTHFHYLADQLSEYCEENISIKVSRSERDNSGSVFTIAELEGITTGEKDQLKTDQTTITFRNDTDTEKAIGTYYVLQEDSSIAVIEWIEISDERAWGKGLGRLFHELVVDHIDQTTNADRIYSQLEEPNLQSVLIDSGFVQNTTTQEPWYHCDL